jgi:hypothetical protein
MPTRKKTDEQIEAGRATLMPLEPKPDRTTDEEGNALTLWERVQACREQVTFIQKQSGPQGQKVVFHEDLIAKVRPVLVEYGIMWHPIEIEVLHHGELPTGDGKVRKYSLVRTVVQFSTTDADPCFINVPVISEALGSDDKSAGKAMTYADKYAIMALLSLQRGADEDPDRMGLDIKPISKQQVTVIEEMIADSGSDRAKFLAFLSVPDVESITVGQYDAATAALRQKARTK